MKSKHNKAVVACQLCNDTGVIETGNNDLPCDCPKGDTAVFNVTGKDCPVLGKVIKQEWKDHERYPQT